MKFLRITVLLAVVFFSLFVAIPSVSAGACMEDEPGVYCYTDANGKISCPVPGDTDYNRDTAATCCKLITGTENCSNVAPLTAPTPTTEPVQTPAPEPSLLEKFLNWLDSLWR